MQTAVAAILVVLVLLGISFFIYREEGLWPGVSVAVLLGVCTAFGVGVMEIFLYLVIDMPAWVDLNPYVRTFTPWIFGLIFGCYQGVILFYRFART
jgi:hypothetical protein